MSPFVPFERARPGHSDARGALRTLRDLLRFAVSRFEAGGLAYGQGTTNPRDEAAWLLLWSLHYTDLSPRAAAWWVVGVCLFYGAIDEVLQIPVGRTCSMKDWVADASGTVTVVAVALVIGAAWHLRRA